MLNSLIITFGKLFSTSLRLLNLGDGSTWPGHIALSANKHFINQVLQKSKTKIIIVAGTNGKTTTSSLIAHVLTQNSKSVLQNKSGANLLNGIASSILLHCNKTGKLSADFAIFEIDESNLSLILQEIEPDYLILLNLFRDQLDRYGEVNIVAGKWKDALQKLANKTTLILNADDPQIAYLGTDTEAKTQYFCFNDLNHESKITQLAADSTYCPNCDNKLTYKKITFSHLGDWLCENCGLKRPRPDIENFPIYPLPGTYNKYNIHAAALVLNEIGLDNKQIEESFSSFKPAFGRQEIVEYKGKNVQIFLSKNPTSFNQSFKAITELQAKTLLIVLNDRIPDGRDISWIWDTDISGIDRFKHILVSGDRVYDMALRLKYELGIKNYDSRIKTHENLKDAIEKAINSLNKDETLYVLPTYSAMLETRKILTGKKIL
jgi:lipid II isoglutaminyl synthase (glutamine-hydrolysing)